MFDPETMQGKVEWKQARPEDAAIWVSVTRRSADQMPLESEEAQITRYKEEGPEQQSQRFLLWRGDKPIGRLRFYAQGIPPNWMDLCFCLKQVVAWQFR
jgi:hypothetical protein